MKPTNTTAHRLAMIVLIVGKLAGARGVFAQDSSMVDHGRKMVRVTLALPQKDTRNTAIVKRVRGREKNDLIVLRNDQLTPEMVASSVASLSAAIQVNGIEAPRDAMVRVRPGSAIPPALDDRNRMHYSTLIQRLRSAPIHEVPGIGKARTVDFFILTSKKP
jgi:hypothetical protein